MYDMTVNKKIAIYLALASALALGYILLMAINNTPRDTPVTQSDVDKLSIGMTREEVIAQLGPPSRTSTSVQKGVEYLFYELAHGISERSGRLNDFLVRMENGKVASFGQVGDFDN
jgi:hypothetical protein